MIGINLCPFAKLFHVKEQIRYAVTAAADADQLLAELEQELQLLDQTNPQVLDTTLLIHPKVMGDFLDFHFFLAEANALIRRLGFDGVFQIASLHPDYLEFAGSAPRISTTSRIVRLTRRFTCCGNRVLTGRWLFSDAADIFERNIETLQNLGHAGWKNSDRHPEKELAKHCKASLVLSDRPCPVLLYLPTLSFTFKRRFCEP